MRNAFQLFDPFRLCDGSAEPAEQVHMVLYSADGERGAIQRLGNAAQIGMQGSAYRFFTKKGPALFG